MFENVTKDDVMMAIAKYKKMIEDGKANANREAVSYDLIVNGECFPHKYILGIAHMIANETDEPLNSDLYLATGNSNKSAQKVLEDLGFEVLKREKKSTKKAGVMNTKNIILYGPPGVGKTYNHKKLISLIESGMHTQEEIFNIITKNTLNEKTLINVFEKLRREKRFKFITFHQSYSYEDFIEGFRPNKDGGIVLEDGIFKEICQPKKNIELFDIYNRISFFKTECLDNDVKVIDILKKMKEFVSHNSTPTKLQIEEDRFVVHLDNNSVFEITNYELYQQILKKIAFKLDIEIESIKEKRKDRYTQVLVDFLLKRLQETKYYNEFIDINKKILKAKKSESQKNYYIVIDEINRGNISKIFGELITLIEDDKRDEIEVTLPYSKESFKVPSNLYIIATMNSTDKSIALIDVALRRRFTFLKMEPDESLVDSEALDIFTKLNELIKSKLGEDYLIGHSYFMDCDLPFVLEYKIKPLLEEYFYSDEEGLKEALEIIGYSF